MQARKRALTSSPHLDAEEEEDDDEGDVVVVDTKEEERGAAAQDKATAEDGLWWQIRDAPNTQLLTPQTLPRLLRGLKLSACHATPRVWHANDFYVRFLRPDEAQQEPMEIDGGFLRRDWVLKKESNSGGATSWLFVQSKKRTELGLKCVAADTPQEWLDKKSHARQQRRVMLFLVYELRRAPPRASTRTTGFVFLSPTPLLPPPPAASALPSIPLTSAPFMQLELQSLEKSFLEDVATLRADIVHSFATQAKALAQSVRTEVQQETEKLAQKYRDEFRRLQQVFAGSTQVSSSSVPITPPSSIPSSSQDVEGITFEEEDVISQVFDNFLS